MNISDLTPGIHPVRITDQFGTVEFSLSVVSVHGVTGVAGFEHGQKIPRRGKHLLLSDNVRNWIEQMEAV